jgi:large subunit ribosomal protein L13
MNRPLDQVVHDAKINDSAQRRVGKLDISEFRQTASMNCYQAKAGELVKHWYLIDAQDKVVGRLAAQIAPILMGKHRPTYTPHIDTGDYVIVTNVEKVVFTGDKWHQKLYQRYTGYPGGQKDEVAWTLFKRRPERILELAIQRMMPKNKLGRHMMAKLKLYVGPNHPHQAQRPIPLDAVTGRPAPAGAVRQSAPEAKPGGSSAAEPTEPAATPPRAARETSPPTGEHTAGAAATSAQAGAQSEHSGKGAPDTPTAES